MQSYDVVIVGAGISGIGAPNLQKVAPLNLLQFLKVENIGNCQVYSNIQALIDSDMHTAGI